MILEGRQSESKKGPVGRATSFIGRAPIVSFCILFLFLCKLFFSKKKEGPRKKEIKTQKSNANDANSEIVFLCLCSVAQRAGRLSYLALAPRLSTPAIGHLQAALAGVIQICFIYYCNPQVVLFLNLNGNNKPHAHAFDQLQAARDTETSSVWP